MKMKNLKLFESFSDDLKETEKERKLYDTKDVYKLKDEITDKLKDTTPFSDKYLNSQYPTERFFGKDGELVYSISGGGVVKGINSVTLYFNPPSMEKFNHLPYEYMQRILSNIVNYSLRLGTKQVYITDPRLTL
jgi:hypothetical protein